MVWIKPGWIPVQWSPLDPWSSSKNMMTKLRKSNQPSWPSFCVVSLWFTDSEWDLQPVFFIRSRRYSHWIPLKNNQPGDLCREQRLPALVLTGKNLMARSEVSSLLLWNFGGNRDYSKIYCWSWWAELVETTSKHQPITINNPRCF